MSSRNINILAYGLIILNLSIRLVVYKATVLFDFSDFSVYLNGVENLLAGNGQFLQEGNYMFLLSHLGYLFYKITGSLEPFYILNCLAGSLTSFIVYRLVSELTRSTISGILTILFHTLYTEFMVFSSVFYTPVIMMFLVALLFFVIKRFIVAEKSVAIVLNGVLILSVFILTLFLKPELKYFPVALLLFSVMIIKISRPIAIRIFLLAAILLTGQLITGMTGIITTPENNTISNSFVFFGHTDYGGNGGEGAFIYEENRIRYQERFKGYLEENSVDKPTIVNYNSFQRSEMKRFITENPGKWILLQARKFFATFGVMPESVTFRVLYTGLLRGKSWLTAIITVAPVVLTLSGLILTFNTGVINRLTANPRGHTDSNHVFLLFMALMFLYYLVASVFYGQYQERYRMTLMVLFIIPSLAVFIANFEHRNVMERRSILIKGTVLIVFFLAWSVQAHKLTGDNARIESGLKSLDDFIPVTGKHHEFDLL